jgi:hypothetical protein
MLFPPALKLRRISGPAVESKMTNQKLVQALQKFYGRMTTFANLPEADQRDQQNVNRKQKLPELFARVANKVVELEFHSACVWCNYIGANHSPECILKYCPDEAKKRIENLGEEVEQRLLEMQGRKPVPHATLKRGDGDQQPTCLPDFAPWPDDESDVGEPAERRTPEQVRKYEALRTRAAFSFARYVLPTLPMMKGMVRCGDAVDRHLLPEHGFPNPHIHGKSHFENGEGKFRLKESELSAADTILASMRLVVVSPGMFFPSFFDADGFKCPKCDQCATNDSPFVRQGFTYRPRFVYGLHGVDRVVFVDVYRHKGCTAAVRLDGKFGSSQFSALHPKMTCQYSDVVRQWYPFVVSQRTIVTRAVSVFNSASRLAGMACSALASCLAETANTGKTLLENAQMLAELRVRQLSSLSPATQTTMDQFVTRPVVAVDADDIPPAGSGTKAGEYCLTYKESLRPLIVCP